MPKPGSDSKPNISYPTVSLMTNKFLLNRKKNWQRKTDRKELIAKKLKEKDKQKTPIEKNQKWNST